MTKMADEEVTQWGEDWFRGDGCLYRYKNGMDNLDLPSAWGLILTLTST
jgi:hypothetical protein